MAMTLCQTLFFIDIKSLNLHNTLPNITPIPQIRTVPKIAQLVYVVKLKHTHGPFYQHSICFKMKFTKTFVSFHPEKNILQILTDNDWTHKNSHVLTNNLPDNN